MIKVTDTDLKDLTEGYRFFDRKKWKILTNPSKQQQIFYKWRECEDISEVARSFKITTHQVYNTLSEIGAV